MVGFLWDKKDPPNRIAIIVTWLADEEAHVVSENRCVAIEEVARQLHHDRKFCQLL